MRKGFTMSKNRLPRFVFGTMLAMLMLSGPVSALAAPPMAHQAQAVQSNFPTAEAAVDALIGELGKHDNSGFRALMGPGGEKLLESGDKVADEHARQFFLNDYAAHHQIDRQGDNRAILIVGTNDWPMPIPIVQANGSWHFDATAGAQEIINRRIGRNEIAAIRTSLAYADGQEAYHARFGTYATRLFSSPDKYDGLYWNAGPGEPDSPLGPLVAQSVEEGYPGAQSAGKPVPYQGYYFRILKGQGPSAPGGRKSYMSGGTMTGGYALLAWPAIYGSSGITSFIIDQDGIVFQKDLGPNTAKIVIGLSLYDPDITWARIDITP